ncbi:UNVERIFIED_CONTAM: hypothetical protein FKN15_029357 [Acipenser sinensis]
MGTKGDEAAQAKMREHGLKRLQYSNRMTELPPSFQNLNSQVYVIKSQVSLFHDKKSPSNRNLTTGMPIPSFITVGAAVQDTDISIIVTCAFCMYGLHTIPCWG